MKSIVKGANSSAMTDAVHPDDEEFVRALEEQIVEMRKIGAIKFRSKERFTATQASAILGSDDKDFIGDLYRRGKVFKAKDGNVWEIPRHHLARYARSLWANQWATYEPVAKAQASRSVAAGGLTLDAIEEWTGLRSVFERAIEEGTLPRVTRDGETYVFSDDLDSFIEENKGRWIQAYHELEGSSAEPHARTLGQILAFEYGGGIGRVAPDAPNFDESHGHNRTEENVWGTLPKGADFAIVERLAFPGDTVYPR